MINIENTIRWVMVLLLLAGALAAIGVSFASMQTDADVRRVLAKIEV